MYVQKRRRKVEREGEEKEKKKDQIAWVSEGEKRRGEKRKFD